MAAKEPIFFYGHHSRSDGRHVFSQFYPCKFKDDEGYEYNCAEQYMMAQKAVHFLYKSDQNYGILDQIMETRDPAKIKGLGRKIRGFTDEEWDEVKEEVVYWGNYYKFSQNPDLKKILIKTQGCELFEASPTDTIWGIGVDETIARMTPRSRWGQKYWKGKNLLGFALMQVRDELTKKSPVKN